MRGEFEYVSFANFKNVSVNIATLRAAAGVKF
jgi:hypothetical protein